jgi:TonB family protein
LSLIGASASGIRGLRGARVVVMLNSHLDSLTRALDILEAEYILGKTTDKQIRSSGQTFFGLSCAFVDLPVESVSLSFNDRLDRFHNIALEFEWSGRAIESVIMIRSHSPRIESRIRENPRLQNLIDLAINYTKTSFRCLAGYPKRDRIYIGIKEEPIAAAEDPAIKPEVDCSRTSFHYPRDALRAEAAGRVRVRFGLNQSGEVTHTEILRSAGNSREHKLLDQAALDRLAGCTFRAARDHLGVPVSSIAEVEFAFRIE